MKINLEHAVTESRVIIETEHDDPDEPVKPRFASDSSDAILIAKDEFNEASGHYGHLIDIESTTNLDLATAARQLPSFKLISVEPEIKANPIPPGANT